jgi:acyl-CoA thioesterase-2
MSDMPPAVRDRADITQSQQEAMRSLLETMSLRSLGPNDRGEQMFTGPSQQTRHGRVFGGQILGQSMMAATLTVDQPRPVHSMHAYFMRPGDASQPIHFDVENMRDGGSFSARRVRAMQHDRILLSMTASFQRPDGDAFDHQHDMPEVPPPEELPSFEEIVAGSQQVANRFYAQRHPFDLRHVTRSIVLAPDPDPSSVNAVWMRPMGPLPDDPALHAAILAYASDYTLLEAVLRRHGLAWVMPLRTASLDHAMWWHRAMPVDDWLLCVQTSPSASGGRGLGMGRIFARDGTLVATAAQEGMVRLRRQ